MPNWHMPRVCTATLMASCSSAAAAAAAAAAAPEVVGCAQQVQGDHRAPSHPPPLFVAGAALCAQSGVCMCLCGWASGSTALCQVVIPCCRVLCGMRTCPAPQAQPVWLLPHTLCCSSWHLPGRQQQRALHTCGRPADSQALCLLQGLPWGALLPCMPLADAPGGFLLGTVHLLCLVGVRPVHLRCVGTGPWDLSTPAVCERGRAPLIVTWSQQ